MGRRARIFLHGLNTRHPFLGRVTRRWREHEERKFMMEEASAARKRINDGPKNYIPLSERTKKQP